MQPVPDKYLLCICAFLIFIPNVTLLYRIVVTRKHGDRRTITVESSEDHRDHLFVYLFAVLFPLFDANIGRPRDSLATVIALLFVVLLFWYLEIHYANVFFAIAGFRLYTIRAERTGEAVVLLTRRTSVPIRTTVHGLRLSNTVLLETGG